jgi:polyisoprenoid-binding protein YceI
MKKFLSLLAGIFFAGAASANAAEYGFDKAHSHVGFSVTHILSKVSGEFKSYDGTFKFDSKDPSADSVAVTIDVTSISTDNEMRDHHLQSPDFFDAAKYPTITFTSTSVAKTGDNDYKITGDLTMHGVTKSVVLDTEYLGADSMPLPMSKDPKDVAQLVGFNATTKIDRRDFGLTWGQDKLTAAGNLMVANDVTIELDIAGEDTASLKKMMEMMKNKMPKPAPAATPAN